ncbi:U3 snoRNP protein [Coniosporium apollinis]|uniref:U3 snoRNP protein n=1 Tax=Coniosporium apollinis TaxID=61459 RepID=A0ABQ9NRZ8_9PEZI|nr:U3 snoRNP protein [Coniosporium apollinis]
MPAMSRGEEPKAYKVTKRKGGTQSSRKHHFESFSQRIAKLNIDPVRKTRRNDLDEEGASKTSSYFRTAFDEWKDLNLSENFVRFSQEVEPLCDSLPQILHYDGRIMDIVIKYIERMDALSLQPILGLVSHFAHDLGVRFEKHFQRTVAVVCKVAAQHPDVEVIEWSFTCLTWLFKYLSRLLVPDLRPLYDLMAPLLGKISQKPFITRFAAESMSFLIRKAGATYHRSKEPLQLIINHAVRDLDATVSENNAPLYQQGLSALFTEAIKGVRGGLHSSGDAVFQELLAQTHQLSFTEHGDTRAKQVLYGVLVALIHHTNSETFAPTLEIIVNFCQASASGAADSQLKDASRLLFIVSAVRKGTRIQDWKPLLSCVSDLVEFISSRSVAVESGPVSEILATLAVVFQSAPLDALIPHIRLLDHLVRDEWQQHFLPFCNFFAELGRERFESLVLPHFQKFIAGHWESQGDRLSLLLPRLANSNPQSALTCPQPWQEYMLNEFRSNHKPTGNNTTDVELASLCNGYLETLKVTGMEPHLSTKFRGRLLELLQSVLSSPPDTTENDYWAKFAAGHCFTYWTAVNSTQDSELNLWLLLCQNSGRFCRMPAFWKAMLQYLRPRANQLDFGESHTTVLVNNLVRCLASPSHELRSLSLDILKVVMVAKSKEEPEALSIAIVIESMPLNIETARTVSMHIRRLATSYKTACSDPWLARAIPSYLFGLLHVKFSQVWDDACSALKEICDLKDGEDVVSEIAFSWLHSAVDHEDRLVQSQSGGVRDDGPSRAITEFECTNLSKLDSMARQSESLLQNAAQELQQSFLAVHHEVPFITPSSRSQALRVLHGVPQVAEKKSRLLVPILLRWATDVETFPEAVQGSDEEHQAVDSESFLQRWTRKDQKAMLSLFAQFKNPKVLYKSVEVYSALLGLAANGDVEIQKSALKAILTWKSEHIIRYEENLTNLLDDARFREQISVFLNIGDDDSTLQEEHRAEIMPVVLRLLYGKVVARTGSASGRRGQESRRKAVFIALTRFGLEEIRQFLRIALGPLEGVSVVQQQELQESVLQEEMLSPRKQSGLVNLLEDMLDTLGTQLTPLTDAVVGPILYCMIRASRCINSGATSLAEEEKSGQQLSLLRSIRQVGFHCLNMLFRSSPDFEWSAFAAVIVRELIEPRLEKLPIETAQSISGILRLVSTWASSPHTARFLIEYNQDILDKVADCLEVPSAQDEVKLFILRDIIGSLISVAGQDLVIRKQIVEPKSYRLLTRVTGLLQGSPSKEVLEAGVQAVANLADFVVGAFESEKLVRISIFLLQQPSKRVAPRTKSDLLWILHRFIPMSVDDSSNPLFSEAFEVVSSLFAFFQDTISRNLLCDVLESLSRTDPALEETAVLCRDLNSFSASRLDTPDFERRARAFTTINEVRYSSFSAKQWRPLLYNMLYFIKDNEEMVIRASASLALRRFIEAASGVDGSDAEAFMALLSTAVLPGLQNGARESSELVRTEYLPVVSQLVKRFSTWAPVSDMHILLVDDDEEASFFSNILHIQQHRRFRALRRLASEATSGRLGSNNISHFFIPLIEHYIFDKSDDENAHNLAAETITTIGALAEWLEWPQYRALLRRYSGYMQSKQDMEKTTIKLLGATVDALSRAGLAKGYVSVGTAPIGSVSANQDQEEAERANGGLSKLSATMPSQQKLSADLINNLLPALTAYIHRKDEATVSLRVPVAVTVVKLLRLLPPHEFAARLPPVLLDISHILKSRDQGSRDMTRKTLADIALLIGGSYFAFLVKALRSALQRGYQLHVLSFTVHSILVSMSPVLKPGDLDYCLGDIVDVIMDDIFGVTGQEKDAEDYISKMKEVKSSKSFDSMELVAKITTIGHLVDLIRPVQSLLLQKLDSRTVKKVDELLRRFGLGIMHNASVQDQGRDILVFCYELIQEVYKLSAEPLSRTRDDDYRIKRYLISMNSANKLGNRGATTSHTYKMIRFALDVFRSVLNKHEALQTPENLAGFMPIIGDALVQGQEEIQISAIRLLTTIVSPPFVPLPKIESDAPIYVAEAVRVIRGASSTNSELAQAALKLISAILRAPRDFTVKENDLAYLLKRLRPDLEEPDRQGVTFNFLRAVMSRKIVIAEVYDVLDTIAQIMVTNQTRTARDLARGVYFDFLMNYPQGKDRLSKQLAFLVKNLGYKYVEGRQSVMEALHLVLGKVPDELAQDVAATVFVPLVMVLVNDDSSACREMAGALLKRVFERADNERMKTFRSLLRTWLEQDEQPLLKRVAVQCWTLYFEVMAAEEKIAEKETRYLVEHLTSILQPVIDSQEDSDWELLYYSLQAFAKISEVFKSAAFAADTAPLWAAVRSCLFYPHAWVKLSAARLMGLYLKDLVSTNAHNLGSVPLIGSGGLQLSGDDDMIQLTNAGLRTLKLPSVTEELAGQTVRNLLVLGRCFAANGLKWQYPNATEPAAAEESENEEGENGDTEMGGAESEEAGLNGVDGEPQPSERKTALQHLIERLSAILRREPPTNRAPSLYAHTASLQLLAALCNSLPTSSLQPSLPTLLLPLHNLTDPAIAVPHSSDPAFVAAHKALRSTAQELMAALQAKLGTSEYVRVLQGVREGVRERREGRRVKRRIEAVREPEKVGREKRVKREREKGKRKERSEEQRGRRRGW